MSSIGFFDLATTAATSKAKLRKEFVERLQIRCPHSRLRHYPGKAFCPYEAVKLVFCCLTTFSQSPVDLLRIRLVAFVAKMKVLKRWLYRLLLRRNRLIHEVWRNWISNKPSLETSSNVENLPIREELMSCKEQILAQAAQMTIQPYDDVRLNATIWLYLSKRALFRKSFLSWRALLHQKLVEKSHITLSLSMHSRLSPARAMELSTKLCELEADIHSLQKGPPKFTFSLATVTIQELELALQKYLLIESSNRSCFTTPNVSSCSVSAARGLPSAQLTYSPPSALSIPSTSVMTTIPTPLISLKSQNSSSCSLPSYYSKRSNSSESMESTGATGEKFLLESPFLMDFKSMEPSRKKLPPLQDDERGGNTPRVALDNHRQISGEMSPGSATSCSGTSVGYTTSASATIVNEFPKSPSLEALATPRSSTPILGKSQFGSGRLSPNSSVVLTSGFPTSKSCDILTLHSSSFSGRQLQPLKSSGILTSSNLEPVSEFPTSKSLEALSGLCSPGPRPYIPPLRFHVSSASPKLDAQAQSTSLKSEDRPRVVSWNATAEEPSERLIRGRRLRPLTPHARKGQRRQSVSLDSRPPAVTVENSDEIPLTTSLCWKDSAAGETGSPLVASGSSGDLNKESKKILPTSVAQLLQRKLLGKPVLTKSASTPEMLLHH